MLADTLLPNNNQLHQLQHRSNSFVSTSNGNGNNNICHQQQQQDGIYIKNLSEGETLSYSLALVRGKAPVSCTYIRVRGCLHRNQVSEWPVINGDFRLLIELQRGSNRLELEAGGFKRKLSLIYEPRPTRLRVTPVYVICDGHDGYFQVRVTLLLCRDNINCNMYGSFRFTNSGFAERVQGMRKNGG